MNISLSLKKNEVTFIFAHLYVQPPKDSKQKKDTSKAKKDKDPVNKSGGKAKKKVNLLFLVKHSDLAQPVDL